MNFAEIEASARNTLDDNSASDNLWSQSELLEYAQDAENEACERANLLIDSITEGVALYSSGITIGQNLLAISELIIEIISFKLDGPGVASNKHLEETTERVMNLTYPNWEDMPNGAPRLWFRRNTNSLWVHPKPIGNNVVTLTVSRHPITPMSTGGSPEIDARYHPGLILWILHRAYMKNDSETLNTDKAKDYGQQFVTWFGKKVIHKD